MSITDEFIPFCLIVFYNCVEQPFIALNNKFFHLMFFVGISISYNTDKSAICK